MSRVYLAKIFLLFLIFLPSVNFPLPWGSFLSPWSHICQLLAFPWRLKLYAEGFGFGWSLILKQCPMIPRLALNLLCNQGWPWTSNAPTSVSQVCVPAFRILCLICTHWKLHVWFSCIPHPLLIVHMQRVLSRELEGSYWKALIYRVCKRTHSLILIESEDVLLNETSHSHKDKWNMLW